MPNFEEASKKTQSSDGANQISITKILGLITTPKGGNSDNMSKSNRANIAFKDSASFYDALKRTQDSDYILTAGSDVSSIFYPFSTKIAQSGIPSFIGSLSPKQDYRINQARLMPMEWASGTQTKIKDRYISPSGDSHLSIVSSEKFRWDIDRFRDLYDQRGIGIRLPIMGVGWGYTNDGVPCPSGAKPAGQVEGTNYPSGTRFFKGGTREGYNVDPAELVAAPIDLRYDPKNDVWTGPKGFWAEIGDNKKIRQNDSPVVSGYAHEWKELYDEPSGYLKTPNIPQKRFGTINDRPAFEANGSQVPSGTKVWIEVPDRTDYFLFHHGGGSVQGTGRYKVYMIIDDSDPSTPIFDYPRFT